MKKSKYIKYIGVALAVLTLVANIQYALLDYGLHTNTLGNQVFAQTNTGGSSGGDGSSSGTSSDDATGTSGGWLWQKVMSNSDCSEVKTVDAWVCGSVVYYVFVSGCTHTTKTVTFSGKMSRCDDGWNFCSSGCEGSGTSTSTGG